MKARGTEAFSCGRRGTAIAVDEESFSLITPRLFFHGEPFEKPPFIAAFSKSEQIVSKKIKKYTGILTKLLGILIYRIKES